MMRLLIGSFSILLSLTPVQAEFWYPEGDGVQGQTQARRQPGDPGTWGSFTDRGIVHTATTAAASLVGISAPVFFEGYNEGAKYFLKSLGGGFMVGAPLAILAHALVDLIAGKFDWRRSLAAGLGASLACSLITAVTAAFGVTAICLPVLATIIAGMIGSWIGETLVDRYFNEDGGLAITIGNMTAGYSD